MRFSLLLIALSGLMSACFVPLSQGQAMENDLRILRDRLVAVEDRAETDDALLRERVAQAQRDAERIRETMAKVDKIARRADANFGEELVSMRQAMATIQGRLETMEHQTSKQVEPDPVVQTMRTELAAVVERVAAAEARLKILEEKLDKSAKTAASAAKEQPKKVVVPTTKNPQSESSKTKDKKVDNSSRSLFRAGRDALRDRRYGRAVELMERWVQLHGKKAGKRSALDDAYVVIGDALKAQKKPKKAIHAYQKVYKMGAARADMWTKAVFRMGQCFETLGDKAGARAFYKMASTKGSGHFAKKSAQRIKRLR